MQSKAGYSHSVGGWKPDHPSKRAWKMAFLAMRMAEDPRFGYSQKPPSGRWGPDFDCSSFIYYIADAVGYPVGTGKDKVRFTGTMLEDFKEAGFQLLPFANVGLGELEVGDILVNLALHAEVYVGEGQMVGAQSSETGGYAGLPGDQTGDEIKKQPAYIFDKGWDYVLRPPSESDEEKTDETSGEEGDEDMAYPYPNTTMGNGSWMPPYTQRTTAPIGYSGTMNGGYPQGNLGQMNGYAQANAGGYPQYGTQQPQGWPQGQQEQVRQLIHAKDLNEVRDIHVNPGECIPVFLDSGEHMVLKSADQQGFPTMRVFKMEECSEDMPQHNPWGQPQSEPQQAPMMQQQQGVTREEIDQLKEMIANVQSAISGSGFPQGNGTNGTNANGQSNGNRSGSNGSSNQSSGRNTRNS